MWPDNSAAPLFMRFGNIVSLRFSNKLRFFTIGFLPNKYLQPSTAGPRGRPPIKKSLWPTHADQIGHTSRSRTRLLTFVCILGSSWRAISGGRIVFYLFILRSLGAYATWRARVHGNTNIRVTHFWHYRRFRVVYHVR